MCVRAFSSYHTELHLTHYPNANWFFTLWSLNLCYSEPTSIKSSYYNSKTNVQQRGSQLKTAVSHAWFISFQTEFVNLSLTRTGITFDKVLFAADKSYDLISISSFLMAMTHKM